MTAHYKTIPELLQFISKNYRNPSALGYKKNGQWIKISTDQFISQVEELACGLLALGIKPGDKVGIMAEPGPHWVFMDMAVISTGAVTVPMFSIMAPFNIKYQIEETEMKTVFLSGESQYDIISSFAGGFEYVITLEEIKKLPNALTMEGLIAKGAENAEENRKTLLDRKKKVQPQDIATIIYTSGSTGVPKGAEITHGNIISQVKGAAERFPLDPVSDMGLSCLPLAHVFQRMVGLFCFSQGISAYFAEDIKAVGDNLRELRPTVMTVVPRLMEKVFLKIQGRVAEGPPIKRLLGKAAIRRALVKDSNQPKNIVDRLFDLIVYSKMRQALGGRLRFLISGSAPLSTKLMNFFLNLGVPLYEGYGCTETSPVIAANFPGSRKVGTVGKAFPDVEIKISNDGEILARGPNVMKGYFKKPDTTAQSITEDGWYSTGDLGRLDDEGYLTITGRKKELMKTSGGKYVVPTPIEFKLVENDPFIDMAMVIAEGRKFVSTLLFPDFENLDKLKAQIGCSGLSDNEFLKNEKAKAYFQKAVDKTNAELNQWEQIQEFILADSPATVERGEITPTMKLNRHIVEERYKEAITAFYEKI